MSFFIIWAINAFNNRITNLKNKTLFNCAKTNFKMEFKIKLKLINCGIKNLFIEALKIILAFIVVMVIILNFVEIEKIPIMADFFVKVLAIILS